MSKHLCERSLFLLFLPITGQSDLVSCRPVSVEVLSALFLFASGYYLSLPPPPILYRSWAWVGKKIDLDSFAKLIRTGSVPSELFRLAKEPIPAKSVFLRDRGKPCS